MRLAGMLGGRADDSSTCHESRGQSDRELEGRALVKEECVKGLLSEQAIRPARRADLTESARPCA